MLKEYNPRDPFKNCIDGGDRLAKIGMKQLKERRVDSMEEKILEPDGIYTIYLSPIKNHPRTIKMTGKEMMDLYDYFKTLPKKDSTEETNMPDEYYLMEANIYELKKELQQYKDKEQELITWLESLIDEDNYNPLDWVDYGDAPRYAVDKTIKVILNKIKEVK